MRRFQWGKYYDKLRLEGRMPAQAVDETDKRETILVDEGEYSHSKPMDKAHREGVGSISYVQIVRHINDHVRLRKSMERIHFDRYMVAGLMVHPELLRWLSTLQMPPYERIMQAHNRSSYCAVYLDREFGTLENDTCEPLVGKDQ